MEGTEKANASRGLAPVVLTAELTASESRVRRRRASVERHFGYLPMRTPSISS